MRGTLGIGSTFRKLGAALLMLAWSTDAVAAKSEAPPPPGMSAVGPGVYRPLYPTAPEEASIRVPRFWLDVLPVSNADFVAFVREHGEWRRDRIKPIFADEGYLSQWALPDELGLHAKARQPVTRVSWFAAKAYCASRGAHLPTERQWELAALASETKPDASGDPAFSDRILAWYSEPSGQNELREVGRGSRNYWGIRDLHGLVWEWVADFNASLVDMDSRDKDGSNKLQFCGGAGASARDPSDYAAFMRVAFRSSLQARYTTARLGFRCARNVEMKQ
jgi:formylglycine-generating enzyme required for sulfatase activity